jgi:poly(A) polymerase
MSRDTQKLMCVIPESEPWISGRQLSAVLTLGGFETYAAGGCVRDLILNRTIKDIDLATAAHPEQVELICKQQGWQTVAVGKSFGVIIVVMPSGLSIEVATFRNDGAYVDGRRPVDVSFHGTVKDDVERRDFTINALMINMVNGQILDYVGGVDDINNKKITAVGNPVARLKEDRLRILRALRFSACLDFHLHDATWAAVCSTSLDGVSRERVIQEWKKAMSGSGRRQWFELLHRSGHLISVCAPVATYDAANLQILRSRLDRLLTTDHEAVILAVWLLAADHASALAWMDSMPMSSDWKRTTTWVLKHGRNIDALRALPLADRRRCWRHPEGQLLVRLLELQDQAGTVDLAAECAQEPGDAREPLLKADDLISLGIAPGRDFGVLLRRIEDGQLAGELRDVPAAIAFVREWLQQKNKET